MYEPLILIGLGVDLLGALFIVLPEITTSKFIKKQEGVVRIAEQQKVDPFLKYRYLKNGVILLMIGFFAQLIGHVIT